jgi:hypothetical protein
MAGERTGRTAWVLIKRFIVLIGIGMLATAAQKPQHIPLEYRGSWSLDTAYCNFEGDTLDTELYVSADTVGFHAEHHQVKSVKRVKGKLLLSYFKLEDAYRVPPNELVLSKDKSKLNSAWHRCPDVTAQQEAK